MVRGVLEHMGDSLENRPETGDRRPEMPVSRLPSPVIFILRGVPTHMGDSHDYGAEKSGFQGLFR